jgi:hypothetical protein
MRGTLSRAPLQHHCDAALRLATLFKMALGQTHVGIPPHYLEHAHSNVSSA